MKTNTNNFPKCESCQVFNSPETTTTTARAIFCEGLRVTGMCPKDTWKEAFEKELREKLGYVRSFQKTCVLKDKPMFEWEESTYREILGENK